MNKILSYLNSAAILEKSKRRTFEPPTILKFESARTFPSTERRSQPVKNRQVANGLKIFRGDDSQGFDDSKRKFVLRIFDGEKARPSLRVFTG